MKKFHAMSALALMLVIGGYNSSWTFAEGEASQSNGGDLKSQAESVRDAAANNPSKLYPGLDKYLDKVLKEYDQRSKYENPEAVESELNEAVRGASLILGINKGTSVQAEESKQETQTVAQINSNVARNDNYAASNVSSRQTTVNATVAQTEAVADATNDAAASNADKANESGVVAANNDVQVSNEGKENQTQADEAENKAEDKTNDMADEGVAELPNTGTESNVGKLIVAGVIVVVVTIGSTLLVLKWKKTV